MDNPDKLDQPPTSPKISAPQLPISDDAKDRFFAFLSHEFRTPLTPVLAALSSPEFVRAVPLSLQHILDLVRHNVEREARLIDDLLDVTRISHGKLELRKKSVNIHNILRAVADAFADEIHRHRLSLVLELHATQDTANADAARLQQAFSNLLTNSIKFTPANGKIIIRSTDAGPDQISINFIDNGVGIVADNLERLFEPLEHMQLPSQFAGELGLGLPIAHGVIEAHGGKIKVSSPGLGKGSTFEIMLPVTASLAATAPALASAAAPSAQSKAKHPNHTHAFPKRILIVEDHADTAEVMAHLLRHEGHDVVIANSAHEALMLASEPFDVIVSDLGLPDGSGLDVMRAFTLAQERIHGIALSGFAATEDIRQSYDAGFAEHLAKPVAFPRLLLAIDQLSTSSAPSSQA